MRVGNLVKDGLLNEGDLQVMNILRDLRNDVVHRGVKVTDDQAEGFAYAVKAWLQRLEEVRQRASDISDPHENG